MLIENQINIILTIHANIIANEVAKTFHYIIRIFNN